MKEQVTLSPIALKRAYQFALDSGINEVFVYQHESGKNYITNPAPSVPLDDDSHPTHHTPHGVYIKSSMLHTLLCNGRAVELTQIDNAVRLRYI